MNNVPNRKDTQMNFSDIQDQLFLLAKKEDIHKWDIGAAFVNDSSVQVDKGEAKQIKSSDRRSLTIRVWNHEGLIGITSTSDLSESGLKKC